MVQVTSAFPVAQNPQSDLASIGVTALEPIFPVLASINCHTVTPARIHYAYPTPTTGSRCSRYNIIPASYPNPIVSGLHTATPANDLHTYLIPATIWVRIANPVIIDYAYCNPASIGFHKPTWACINYSYASPGSSGSHDPAAASVGLSYFNPKCR